MIFTIHFWGCFPPIFWKHPTVIDKGVWSLGPLFLFNLFGFSVGWFEGRCWPWWILDRQAEESSNPPRTPATLTTSGMDCGAVGGWWWSWWWWRGKGKQEMWICGGWLVSCLFSDWSDETVLQLDMIGWRHKRRRYLWCRCVLQMLERQSVYHKGLCFQDIGSTNLHSHIWTP